MADRGRIYQMSGKRAAHCTATGRLYSRNAPSLRRDATHAMTVAQSTKTIARTCLDSTYVAGRGTPERGKVQGFS